MRQKMPKNTKLYFSAFLLHFLEICVSCVGIFSHTPQKSRKRQKIKMERFLLVPDSLFYFHLLENGRMKNADGPNYTGETGEPGGHAVAAPAGPADPEKVWTKVVGRRWIGGYDRGVFTGDSRHEAGTDSVPCGGGRGPVFGAVCAPCL